MKKFLYIAFVLIAVVCFSVSTKGQSVKQMAYTITDSVQNGLKWNYLRKLDLRTGTFSEVLLRLLSNNDTIVNSPIFNGIAAMAFDNKNGRLYFTPMLSDRLSYVNLRTMRTHVVTNNFSGLIPKANDQSNIFTRMVIDKDDNGFALTNDGKHLVKFNTNNHRISDLGSLINAPQNEVSVHEICSSYGGDIIAAENDFLYLITSRNHVFKIKITTKVAKYMGTITGLSENFTTSGAAVDYRNNYVVIGSSVNAADIYSVDLKTLISYRLSVGNVWHSSDMANGNILKVKKDDEDEDIGSMIGNINLTGLSAEEIIQVFPNPVTSKELKIRFANTSAGTYEISVLDITGQSIINQTVSLAGKNNIVKVKLPALTAKGVYIVKIAGKNNRTVFSGKIILL